MLLESNESIKHDQFHVVVTLLHNQLNVTTRRRLKITKIKHEMGLKWRLSLQWDYGELLCTLTAVGALDRVTNVPAASYRTAGLEEFSRL